MYNKSFLESYQLSGNKSMIDLQNKLYGPEDDDEEEDEEDEDWEYEDEEDDD